ncbi:glutathione-dependent formaldehyde-activating enzyme family protein, partial [Acinetobacter baumannii]
MWLSRIFYNIKNINFLWKIIMNGQCL